MNTKEQYDFVFYYEERVSTTSDKEKALAIFRNGGFYKSVCYFPREHSACFRIIESEEDILSL